MVSLTGALREANQDLRTQLQKEREEERRKIFHIKETTAATATTSAVRATNLWRKALEASTSPISIAQPPKIITESDELPLNTQNGNLKLLINLTAIIQLIFNINFTFHEKHDGQKLNL